MRVGVYIDGYNLYYGGRGLCGRSTPGWRWLNLRTLASGLIATHSRWQDPIIETVTYCTARVSGASNPIGQREQDVYLRALDRTGSATQISYGNYVARVATAPLATAGGTRCGPPTGTHTSYRRPSARASSSHRSGSQRQRAAIFGNTTRPLRGRVFSFTKI